MDEDEFVTRGVLASTVAELLGIGPETVSLASSYPSFEDVAPDHPVYLQAEVLRSLGALPTYIHNRFEPDRPATRAEVAHLLSKVSAWSRLSGEISEVAEDAAQIMVQAETGLVPLSLTTRTAVYSRGELASPHSLEAGDVVFALYNDAGEALLVSKPQRGLAALVDTDALMAFLNKSAQVLNDVLTPEQVSAVLNGDWQTLSDEVRYELHQRLVDLSVSPWEVDALLSRTGQLSRDRQRPLSGRGRQSTLTSAQNWFCSHQPQLGPVGGVCPSGAGAAPLTSSWLKSSN